MSIVISLSVGTLYGLHTFGYMGSSHDKHCLANQVDYHPYIYKNQEEMMKFLDSTGAENVTDKFDSVILYGFLANMLYIFTKIYTMGNASYDGRVKTENSPFLVFGDFLVGVLGVVQYGLVVVYRFSHTGMVCSGDYAVEELII